MWRRLMDAVEGIGRAAQGTPGVRSMESVRARWGIGHRLRSGVRVAGSLSVAEGRRVSEHVREAARKATPKLDRVTVELSPSG
jgi:divalent metal cation (Fe/Co/Zn/Cd) transporter